jgi:hypothetical protein
MAHFAKLVNNVVVDIHVVSNEVITDGDGVEQENLGREFLADLHGYSPSKLVQCSYNGNFRGAYPGVGWTYDSVNDVFVAPIVEETE